MFALILAVLFVYYAFAFRGGAPVGRPDGEPPVPRPFDYAVRIGPRGETAEVATSGDRVWEVPEHADYYHVAGGIRRRDACFGEADGAKVRASGRRMYDIVHRGGAPVRSGDAAPPAGSDRRPRDGRVFYFGCLNGGVASMHACSPGSTFVGGDCVPVNMCTGERDGFAYPDASDARFYRRCVRGSSVRVRCAPYHYFVTDSCRSVGEIEDACRWLPPDSTYPIDRVRYVRCRSGRPVVLRCGPGKRFSNGLCRSTLCSAVGDGVVALPAARNGPFSYSPGHALCVGGEVSGPETTCPRHWDPDSASEDLLHLPMVFDERTLLCAAPSFCENVTSDSADTVVPVLEMKRFATDWDRSALFDASVGVRCEGRKKTRAAVGPGNVVGPDYAEVSGCDAPGARVVLGEKIGSYHDCDSGAEVHCPVGQFFDGRECRERSPLAHTLRGMSVVEPGGLSSVNGWMRPPAYAREPAVPECRAGETYLEGYNVCAHAECAKYPFLSQVGFGILERSFPGRPSHLCIHASGRIRRRRNPHAKAEEFAVSYWEQKLVPPGYVPRRDCVRGDRTRSGTFAMDAVLYATCDDAQPFVLCPSPHTGGIATTKGGHHACVPRAEAYEGVVAAGTEAEFYCREIDRMEPVDGASYVLNGAPGSYDAAVHPRGLTFPNDGSSVKIRSEGEVKVFFRMLITYPLVAYWEDGVLSTHHATLPFILKADGSTERPLTVADHRVAGRVVAEADGSDEEEDVPEHRVLR